MKLAMMIVLSGFALGCDRSGEGDKGRAGQGTAPSSSSAPAAASAAPAAAPAVSFAGTYRAAWGDTVFSHTGTAVNATYPGGALACTAKDRALDCTWKEGSAAGKARLEKQTNGIIEGTWGNGASDSDGGKWTFTPKGS